MKITDKELRACAKGGHLCRSDNRQRYAVEILALRSEIRRLRKALNEIADAAQLHSRDSGELIAQVKRCCLKAIAALVASKPRKPARKPAKKSEVVTKRCRKCGEGMWWPSNLRPGVCDECKPRGSGMPGYVMAVASDCAACNGSGRSGGATT